MRLRTSVLSLLVGATLLGPIGPTMGQSPAADAAGPNRITCEGYPEHRLYMENQSWVRPQPGPLWHPGTGEQGHIHVATCFPLDQHVTASHLPLDVFVQLHNVPGTAYQLRVKPYPGVERALKVPLDWRCPTVTCDRWIHVDYPMDSIPFSGWTEFAVWLDVRMTNGLHWYNINRWFLYVDNGRPLLRDMPTPYIGGDTWLPSIPIGSSNYSKARIAPSQFPWNFHTGEAIPLSGIWSPTVKFQESYGTDIRTGTALIDPQFHAVPPDNGVVVYDGSAGTHRLRIDTNRFANGPHRLLLVACTSRTNGMQNCGVLVVPFEVENQ